jgi:hypothetical protein
VPGTKLIPWVEGLAIWEMDQALAGKGQQDAARAVEAAAAVMADLARTQPIAPVDESIEPGPLDPIAAGPDPAGDQVDVDPDDRILAGAIPVQTARERLAIYRYTARLKRQEYEVRKGQLVEAAAVRADAENTALRVRSCLLALPPKLAPLLEGRTIPQIEELLAAEINEALTALHDSSHLASSP